MSTLLPHELRAQVLRAARATPSPDATQTKRANLAAVALGVATAVTMIAALGLSLGGRPLAFVVVSAAGWAALAGVATTIGGARGRSMLGRARPVLIACALVMAPAIFGWVMGCTLGWPEVRQPSGGLRQHVACFLMTLLLSLGPLVALAFVRRNGDPVHPRATGAAIGAAAGAWGGVLIDMHCPLAAPLHVAVAHVMPVLVYATVGALVGFRLFGVTAKR